MVWQVRGRLPGWISIAALTDLWLPEVLLWLDRLGVALLVVGAVMVLGAPPVRYQILRWQVGKETVYVRNGLVRLSWRITPIARVQAVHLRRNPLELLLGLTSLSVSSASSYGPVVVEGLDRQRAAAVASELQRVAADVPGEAT